MSVGAIIYLIILLIIFLGGFIFFIVMDLKNHVKAKNTNKKKKNIKQDQQKED